MKRTYDDYLLQGHITRYSVHNETFDSLEYALQYAQKMLSQSGEMVMATLHTIPDVACKKCGEMLFSFQTKIGERAGEKNDEVCYVSSAYGLICARCMQKECALDVCEVIISAHDAAHDILLCHLV